jgi:cellulose synthase/poly-beta-1,6-N-acetylglucosamine synthase-like glycosyltransferase
MLVALFWFSAGFVFYTYVGYPLLLKGIVLFRKRPILKGTIFPSVSLIITAFNEERRLAAKLENTLKVHYPREQLEIIVASDCSEDKTDEIVRSYEAQGVQLIRAPERREGERPTTRREARAGRSSSFRTSPPFCNRTGWSASFKVLTTRRSDASAASIGSSTRRAGSAEKGLT